MFAKGIISGWMIPSMESAKIWIILMALGDFTHIVVGSVEVFALISHAQVRSESAKPLSALDETDNKAASKGREEQP